MNSAPDLVERVRLVRVSPTLAFAEVRFFPVNLFSLRCEVDSKGKLQLTAPTRPDSRGQARPCYALQPEARAAIEAEVTRLWWAGDA
jgi:hypothetical protein